MKFDKPIEKYIDYTLLKADAGKEDIKRLCSEAKENGFYAVCVNGCHVALAAEELAGADVKIAAVVGFPLGASSTDVKAYETNDACANGAHEIDMVINIGALKEGDYEYVLDDIAVVVACADEYGAGVKAILETCLLTEEEIRKACELAVSAGVEFVKTSTGFGGGGASEKDIALMRKTVGNMAQIKAAGGIRDRETCIRMIAAGADRIGTSSLLF